MFPHHQIVEALVESFSFRQIGVIQEEYRSKDVVKMFGVLDLGPRFPDADSRAASETLTTRA